MDLRRFSKLMWGPSKNILERIYLSIAEPMFLCAAPIWITATKYKWCVTKLRAVQRLMLSITIRSFRSISTKTALVLTNSLPIEKRALVMSTLASIKKPLRRKKIGPGASLRNKHRKGRFLPSMCFLPGTVSTLRE